MSVFDNESELYKMADLAVSSSLLVRLSVENPLSDIQVNLLTVLTLNSVNDHIYVLFSIIPYLVYQQVSLCLIINIISLSPVRSL